MVGFSWFRRIWGGRNPNHQIIVQDKDHGKQSETPTPAPEPRPVEPQTNGLHLIRRHFYNETGFQTYGSFFSLWEGWASAGHVLSEASELIPDFCGPNPDVVNWPGGLDAALIGCTLPTRAPTAPTVGQDIIVKGYPAGSRYLEERRAKAYYEREPGVWIAHITLPDEPVVTGMSGGVVVDARNGHALGILITRNSPADLNADRDPDESCDFVALSAIWDAAAQASRIA